MGVEEIFKEFYTLKDVAKLLSRNLCYVYKLINRGELPYYNIASRRYVHKDDLEAYIRNSKVVVEKKERKEKTARTPTPSQLHPAAGPKPIIPYAYRIEGDQILPR